MGDTILDADQIKKEFFDLLESLRFDEWDVMVNRDWTVKDVVSHLVAWEEEAAVCLRDSWQTKEKPWFMNTDDYDEFNCAAVNKYRNYKPKDLIERWKFVLKVLDSEIYDIGVSNLRRYPELFEWVFDEEDESHYLEHLEQIKRVLGR